MSTKETSRRQFMELASGLLAVPFMAPFAASMLPASAVAATGKPPLRLLTILDSYGIPPGARRRPMWAKSTANDYLLQDSDLGSILSEFKAFKENMLVVSGIDLTGVDGLNHDLLSTQCLTGSKHLSSGPRAGSGIIKPHASLDVRIGNYLNNEYGLSSPRVYPHVFLSSYAEATKATFCFDSSGKQIRAVSGINNVSRLLVNQGGSNTQTLQNGVRQDVLGMVQSKIQALRGQLVNTNSATVLDAYRTSVEQLASEIEILRSRACGTMSFPSIDTARAIEHVPNIMKAIGHAFSCDLASSITYSIGGETINQHSHQFLYNAQEHNDSQLQALLRRNYHAASHRSDAVADKTHELVRIYQAQLIAELLETLQSTTDVDGSSVLDNTVVFWTSAMSHNTHQATDFPYLLIAGKKSRLKGGYHYQCSDSTSNDLLTTIAQGLTLPDDHFGGYERNGSLNQSRNNGPISKMLL